MVHRHRLAHAALAAVYVAFALLAGLEGAVAHALCALAAAAIYAVLCHDPPEDRPPDPGHR